MSRGRLIVMSAPSGTGKTTILNRLREHHSSWRFSVSVTTRPRRPNEVDGADYYFLSEEKFVEKIEAGEFVEWEWVHDHRYGTMAATLESALANGETLLLDIDVKGGIHIKERHPDDTVSIFIKPPNEGALAERLKGRGTEEEVVIKRRLERIPEEMALSKHFDHVVVNDQLDTAVAAVESILKET